MSDQQKDPNTPKERRHIRSPEQAEADAHASRDASSSEQPETEAHMPYKSWGGPSAEQAETKAHREETSEAPVDRGEDGSDGDDDVEAHARR